MADGFGVLASGISGLTEGLLTGQQFAEWAEERRGLRALRGLQLGEAQERIGRRQALQRLAPGLVSAAAEGQGIAGFAGANPEALATLLTAEGGPQVLTVAQQIEKSTKLARARAEAKRLKPAMDEAFQKGDRPRYLQLLAESEGLIADLSGDEALQREATRHRAEAIKAHEDKVKKAEDEQKVTAYMTGFSTSQSRHQREGTSESFEALMASAAQPLPEHARRFQMELLQGLSKAGALERTQVDVMDRLVAEETRRLHEAGEPLGEDIRTRAYQGAFRHRPDLVPAYLSARVYDPAAKPTDSLLTAVGAAQAGVNIKDLKGDPDFVLARASVMARLENEGRSLGLTGVNIADQMVRQRGAFKVIQDIIAVRADLKRPDARGRVLTSSVQSLDRLVGTLNAEASRLTTRRNWLEEQTLIDPAAKQELERTKARITQIEGALPDLQRQRNAAAAEMEKETGKQAGQVPVSPPPAPTTPVLDPRRAVPPPTGLAPQALQQAAVTEARRLMALMPKTVSPEDKRKQAVAIMKQAGWPFSE